MHGLLYRIVITVSAIGMTVVIAFFRWTKLFGTSLLPQTNLDLSDLEQEGVCRSASQAQQFLEVQKVLRTIKVNPEMLNQAYQVITELISNVERAGSQESAILHTTRVQVRLAQNMQPSEEDIAHILNTIRQPSYPPTVRNKIKGILERSGIMIGKAND